jgi:hypothetical protein
MRALLGIDWLSALILVFVVLPIWVSVLVLCQRAAFTRGNKLGFKEGYELGRLHANNWWLGCEQDAIQTQRQLGRDEEKKRWP